MTESPADYEAWLPVLGDRAPCAPGPRSPSASRRAARQGGVGSLRRAGEDRHLSAKSGSTARATARRHCRPPAARVTRILDAAGNGRALLSVHSRGAEAEVVQALGAARARGVLHWYSGALSQVDGALEQGLYFSVNASMLATQKGLRLLRALPRDRVLPESDGPFARVGRQRLTPVEIPALVRRIAELWGCDLDEAAAQVWSNMRAVATPRAGATSTA